MTLFYMGSFEGLSNLQGQLTRTPHLTHSTFTKECADLVVTKFGARFHDFVCRLVEQRISGKSIYM